MEFLEMYIDTLEDMYKQKFTNYEQIQQLILEQFGDNTVSIDDIRQYYENNIDEEDLRLQMNNLNIQY